MKRALGPLCCLLASACGGDPDLASFSDQYCDLLKPCCEQAHLKTDGVSCHAAMNNMAPLLGHYDPVAGGKCISKLKQDSSKFSFCTSGMQIPECDLVFAATAEGAKPGESCVRTSDCATSAEGRAACYASRSADDGPWTSTCMIQVKGAAGDSLCVGETDGNSVVIGSSAPWGSVPVPTKGYLCDTTANLFCDSATRRCEALRAVGESCAGNGECVSGATCDYLPGKCVARLPAGSICISTPFCDASTWCDSSEKCVARVADGAACTTSDQCQENSSCTNGACQDAISRGLTLYCGAP
ncbi:MAG: hypothetical protein HY901_38110 [Deltaproteobacteria bacterium]|nr:hypothetical protein [Deltaproteobacteria bacterium]